MGGGDWQQQAQEVVQDIIVQTPDVTVTIKDEPNYWWLLLIAILPIVAGVFLKRKKK